MSHKGQRLTLAFFMVNRLYWKPDRAKAEKTCRLC
ncbi:hypothetical protein SAMN05444724_2484 [Salinivibrio sp. ES.052]|nr:hypothetical protein SAMN05444724_2484 [Salinivibrio sp. ES.052]